MAKYRRRSENGKRQRVRESADDHNPSYCGLEITKKETKHITITM